MAIRPEISLGVRVPDVSQTFSNILLNAERFDKIKRGREEDEALEEVRQRQGKINKILSQVGQPEQLQPGQAGPAQILSQEELIQKAKQIDPVFANKQLNALGLDDPSKRAEASRFAAEVQSLPLDQQNQRIEQRVQTLRAQGRNPSDTAELLQLNPAQRTSSLQGIQLLDLSTKERLDIQAKGISKVTKNKLDAVKADIAATKETFDRASKLRGEIAKASTDFRKQEGAWTRVQASAVDPSPAGDLALIFNFMKVLDPGSTVREGEFAQVGAAGNLPTQAQRFFDQWATGQKLTSGQRKDVVDRAGKLFNAAEKSNKRDVRRFVSIGKQFGVTKDNLLGAELPGTAESDAIQPQQQIQPQPGTPAQLQTSLPPTNAQGWQLMTDAQGNKAYVGPNGEVEEVQ